MKKKKEVERLGIIVDDREGNVLIPDLERNGFEVKVERLKSGDYVYKDVAFERKTMDDFCLSIMDGRLDSQVEEMKKLFKWVFVLISGRIADRTSKINENCIIGKIVSLIMKHNVPTIMVENEKQMAYVIRKVVERYEEGVVTFV